ncbi:MAG TPA: carboxypeptidase-like regulatory domain-containing protein, partial [Flavisolibacter sp.]|nr:carboxypeptidase-like regulatory domain-containing protein [Flavisolibacter sp.]
MSKRRAVFLILTLLAVGHAWAQTKQVRGVVTDSTGNPLANVSVQVSNANIGTKTNESGAFVIQVPASNPNLVVSNIGFETQLISVADRDNVTINLFPSRQAMQEVVVTALGARRNERALGYSVAKVDPALLTQ